MASRVTWAAEGHTAGYGGPLRGFAYAKLEEVGLLGGQSQGAWIQAEGGSEVQRHRARQVLFGEMASFLRGL